MFDARILTIAALQGFSVSAATLGVYLWAELSGRPDDVVRSLTFAALVIGNLALILVNRSWRLPIWRTFQERRNTTLKWILAGAAAILLAILTVPGLRNAFRFGAITPTDWLVAVAAGFAGVACRLVRDLQDRHFAALTQRSRAAGNAHRRPLA
jgi:Ca2+-transporting ATPase